MLDSTFAYITVMLTQVFTMMAAIQSKTLLMKLKKPLSFQCVGFLYLMLFFAAPALSSSLITASLQSVDSHSGSLASDDTRPLVIGVTPRPVFVTLDEQGNLGGLDIALAKAIFAKAGLNVSFRVFPWKRILHLIQTGEVDVALSTSDTQRRREFAHFSSEAFRLGHNLLFARKGDEVQYDPNEGLVQVEGKPILLGVQRGVSYSYEYDNLLDSAQFRSQLVVVDTPPRLVELMLINRVDAFLGSERDLQVEIAKVDAQDKIVPVFYLMSDEEASSHIMFSKASVRKSWVERVDEAMRELKATGRYDEILSSF